MNEQKVLDKLDELGAETSDALERLSGDTALYLHLIKEFFSEDPLLDLSKAVQAHDYKGGLTAAHTLKGTLLNLGLLSLADEAIMMLQLYRADKGEEAEAIFPEFSSIFSAFKGAVLPLLEEKAL